jgi:hypothetical protein
VNGGILVGVTIGSIADCTTVVLQAARATPAAHGSPPRIKGISTGTWGALTGVGDTTAGLLVWIAVVVGYAAAVVRLTHHGNQPDPEPAGEDGAALSVTTLPPRGRATVFALQSSPQRFRLRQSVVGLMPKRAAASSSVGDSSRTRRT